MEGYTLLCASTSLPTSLPLLHYYPVKFLTPFKPSKCFSRRTLTCIKPHPIPISSSLHPTTATQETVEASEIESQYVEIGYISSVHGLQGEVRVKPSTDFPELRFSEPGKRWLKQQLLGREIIQEVELLEGRGHHGQKSWIVKFNDVDKVEQAQQLVGSTILVLDEDRPELEEGDFYARDLAGMRVMLKVRAGID